ncbi:LIM/homeobox protein Lhx9-like isoform X2 [Zootermopsis nevadensis]|uniref:LIM/homeobox protein Lhx9-like isoform X2 n=1 Tax=Zootermopsis nevadensis TaxID=136037 RepID=UPI000B8ED4DD|nr:LIM/homeobox protein Lhx9-like isoform X2 [Zootermopsis nevadensis]
MLKDRETMGVTTASPCPSAEAAVCDGCGGRITDRYYLVTVDRQWHSACLKCCECKLPLDSQVSCFVKDGNIYCKEDFYRLFGVRRCDRCQAGIHAKDLVTRVNDQVYHVDCFTCASCGAVLRPGHQFRMRDGLAHCLSHYELVYSHNGYCGGVELEATFRAGDSPGHYYSSGVGVQKGRPRKRKLSSVVDTGDLPISMRLPAAALEILHPGELSASMESLAYDVSVGSPGNGQQQRTKRMRTSFKHHQLRTMKSYFAINQNPDAKDLKQLAQKTGLSKRVLQNARAKWRRNLMRQENGQQAVAPGNTNGASGGGPPSVGSASVILGDSNSLPPPDEVHHHHHHHHHAQTTQTLSFGDLY